MKTLLTFGFLMCSFIYVLAQAPRTQVVTEKAKVFLSSLSGDEQNRLVQSFEDKQRDNIGYFPLNMRDRKGLEVKDMTIEQRTHLHQLMSSVLSSQGYLKATGIMHLDEILHPRMPERYYPDAYVIGFWNHPDEEIWGFRLEGHHLSLNATIEGDEIRMTPLMFGSNPATVDKLPYAGLRILGQEEDLAFTLLSLMNEDQLKAFVVSDKIPADIFTGQDLADWKTDFDGLVLSEMTDQQRSIVKLLVHEYLHNFENDIAHEIMATLKDTDEEDMIMSWQGATDFKGQYYFALATPDLIIEFDKVEANHIHTIIRNREMDYGYDLLQAHYQEKH